MGDDRPATGNGTPVDDEIHTAYELAERNLDRAEKDRQAAKLAHELALTKYLAEPPIKPLYDRILILCDPEKDRVGSIVMADAHKEKPLIGTVIAVGQGRIMDDGSEKPLAIMPGDRVVYGHYSGLDIPKLLELGEGLKVLREDEVLGRL
jgi:chaperonin GroES